jgi:hypothetical protein
MTRASRLKGARNAQKKCESAVSYHEADSQSTKFAPVHPKYRKLAADVARNPHKYRGKLVALIDIPPEGERAANWFDLGSLDDYTPRDFDDGFITIRDPSTEKLYVILIERNSTEDQAKNGRGLQSMIIQGLKYAMEINAQVAGIAIDVDGGDEADRPALLEAMKWIHNGWSHALLAPALSRLERKESAFGQRMEVLAECESWVYYAMKYGDSRMDYCSWRDSSTRPKAVDEVRKAEDYLMQGRAGVQAMMRWKLEQGWMFAGKHPNFCMYTITALNPKRARSEQLIGLYDDAASAYEEIWNRVVDGATRKDAGTLQGVVDDFRDRRGYDILVRDLVWELRIGWIAGINRSSPEPTNDLVVPVPGLALESDESRWHLLLASLDELLSLNARRRVKEPRVNDLPEDEKERIRQVQVARGAIRRLGMLCYCSKQPVAMVPVGKAEAELLGVPRDWVICPVCDEGGSGSDGKIRAPRAKDIRVAARFPKDPCRMCGSFVGLYDSVKIQVDSLSWQAYGCKSCVLPDAVLKPLTPLLEEFDEKPKKCRHARVFDSNLSSF